MKTAYPNFDENMPVQPIYDLHKWMSAMKDIYMKLHFGATKTSSVQDVTKDWNPNETKEFINWLKYYESGDQHKYKKAQHSYYVNDDINFFVPNPKHVPSPIRNMNEQIGNVQQEVANQAAEQAAVAAKEKAESKEEKRRVIEDHRRKMLGRLNSAEKLLSSQQGQEFAGPEFEKLLSAIYELKKQIQTVNKMTLSAQTIIDLIVRQANILRSSGHDSASNFLVKFAQNTPGDFSINMGETPAGGSQPQGEGSLSNPTPDLFQSPGGPSGSEPKDITDDSAIGQFIENLEDFGITSEKDEDENTSEDEALIDDDVMLDEMMADDNELVVHAQTAPEVPIAAPAKSKPVENLEVDSPAGDAGMTTEQAQNGPDVDVKNDFDALIDAAFKDLTISDIVKKLEDINKIFRNREIGRQLAIVDVMLDHLGLAPYFPTLAEATNKQLEANQYCLTRIEDILSKLRGTMQTSKIDLTNENQKLSPEGTAAKSSLEQEDQKEKQRKEVKKQLQDKTDMEKAQQKPEGEIEGAPEELAAAPAQVEAPQAQPIAPRQRTI